MCIQRVHHTVKCDVRPFATFTDVDKPVVNPWAAPPPCRCEQPRNPCPETRCSFGHNCCWMEVSYSMCPGAPLCGGFAQYHVYEEVCRSKFDPTYTAWVAFDGNNPARDPDPEDRRLGSRFVEGWTPLPVLDERFAAMGDGTEAPFMTSAFVYARDRLLALAMRCYDTMLDLQEARAEREYKRDDLGSMSRLRLSDSGEAGFDIDEEDARLGAEICRLEEELSTIVTEAALWWLVVFELLLGEEGRVEGLSPW